MQGKPTPTERVAALSMASVSLEVARQKLRYATRIVIPQGDKCVLSRTDSYAYQNALRDAMKAIERADKLVIETVNEITPSCCGWPDGHIGRIALGRCSKCGEEAY